MAPATEGPAARAGEPSGLARPYDASRALSGFCFGGRRKAGRFVMGYLVWLADFAGQQKLVRAIRVTQ